MLSLFSPRFSVPSLYQTDFGVFVPFLSRWCSRSRPIESAVQRESSVSACLRERSTQSPQSRRKKEEQAAKKIVLQTKPKYSYYYAMYFFYRSLCLRLLKESTPAKRRTRKRKENRTSPATTDNVNDIHFRSALNSFSSSSLFRSRSIDGAVSAFGFRFRSSSDMTFVMSAESRLAAASSKGIARISAAPTCTQLLSIC